VLTLLPVPSSNLLDRSAGWPARSPDLLDRRRDREDRRRDRVYRFRDQVNRSRNWVE